jgi:virginiamycin A acetyltransferase
MLNAFRARIQRLRLRKLLRDEFESVELRRFFIDRYGISIGLYSYGCFDPTRIPKNTQIGRYCSFAPTAYVFNGNHGLSFLSLHPYLYNPALAVVERETIERSICVFEDDVWVGHNAIVLPSVHRVGRGAVIAAGAVVTRDVPPYAVVAGNPATVKRYRFEPNVISQIEMTRWWTLGREELARWVKQKPELVYGPQRYFQAANAGVTQS